MTDLRTAAQQALEALKNGNRTWDAMAILSAALAQEEQEEQDLVTLFALANNMANNAEILINALQPYAPLQVVHKNIVQQVIWMQESVDRYHAFAQAVHDAHGSKLENGE